MVGQTAHVAFDLEGRFPQFGLPDEQWVVLKEPLPTGTLIVLSASMSILDGQRVEPVITNDQPKSPEDDRAQTARNGGEGEESRGETP